MRITEQKIKSHLNRLTSNEGTASGGVKDQLVDIV